MGFNENADLWGGLDLDSSDLKINYNTQNEPVRKKNYRNARNVRSAINSAKKGKALTNVLSNLKITGYILPYSGGVWPAGDNRCIGAYEDTKYSTVIFWVWNSNGFNQILRYYNNLTDPQNPYGVVQQVMMYKPVIAGQNGWGWTKDTRITGPNLVYGQNAQGGQVAGQLTAPETATAIPGDLLYWCDPVPHEIDISLANICGKLKSWTFYAPYSYNPFANATVFNFALKDFNNALLLDITIPVQPFSDPNITIQEGNNQVLAYIAGQINALYGTYVNAEACGCALIITEVSAALALQSFNYSFSGQVLKVYAQNWYGTQLIDRYFDRSMWQPMAVPKAAYMADTHYLPNNVQNKVWQFRTLYTYRCGSPSAPGIWSQVPTNNLQCDGSNNPLLNYIDVNFSDPNLLDNSTLAIFNQVWFICRALGGSDGTQGDKIVKQLYPCDFLDYDGTNWYCHYKFYNNIISTPLDNTVATQLYDDVPITALAELETGNRMVEAGILQGLNGPDCTSAGYKVRITEAKSRKGYNVSAIIRIMNPLMDDNGTLPDENTSPDILQRRSAIIYDSGVVTSPAIAYPMFGGSYFTNNAPTFNTDWAYNKKRQQMPQAGWPCYLAGTPFYGISKQVSRAGVAQRQDGSIDVTGGPTGANGQELITLYNNFSADFTKSQYDCYSVVNIPNVPPGKYVMRLGSHLCSFGDVLGKGPMYNLNSGTGFHNTSTYVWAVNDFPLPNGGYKYDFEIEFTVTNGDVFIGEFLVSDMALDAAHYFNGQNGVAPSLSGYVIDNNGAVDVKALASGATVERALVDWAGLFNSGIAVGSPPDVFLHKITDHNGFYFLYCLPGGISYTPGALATQVGNTSIHNGLTQYFEDAAIAGQSALELLALQTITQTLPNPKPSHIECILPCDNPSARASASTFIEGSVIDQNGQVIYNATVLYTHGRSEQSDINGKYQILAWGNMAQGDHNNRINDVLIFSLNVLCNGTYPNGQEVGPLQITPFGAGGYTPTNPFTVANFIINELVFATAKKLKRGGSYISGVRYNDYPGRLPTVAELFQIYIPADTEDLSLYPYVVDVNGNPFPAGSYVYGQPDILWNFNSSFKPPVYAVSYNIMRTKDLFYEKYLEWVVNGVQYVSQLANAVAGTPAINTAYNNGNAVAVLLDISNIAVYGSQNPGTTAGYSFSQGDRVRLIFDRDNNLLKSPSANLGQTGQMLDYPITGIYSPPGEAPDQLVVPIPILPFEIKSGFTIEIYTPAAQNTQETQLLYEVGEMFPCTAPGSKNNQHAVTSGVFTNGDTYWRGRLITVEDALTGYTAVYPQTVEAQDVSDQYASVASDIGRPGVINPAIVQLYRPTAMIASGTYLPGDATNGLSTFNPNTPISAEIDRRYGSIMRLFYEMNLLKVVCSGKDVIAPINRNVQYEAQSGTGTMSLSGEFFNPANFYIEAKQLGTDFGASVATNSGLLFGLKNFNANVWRWHTQGEAVISDVFMINFFNQLRMDGVTDAVGVYDRLYEEYVLTYWRKQVINTVPVLQGLALHWQMPLLTGPRDAIYGTGGQPPKNGSTVSMQIIIAGITYIVTTKVILVASENPVWNIVGEVTSLLVNGVASENINAFAALLVANPLLQGQFTYSLPETALWCEGTDVMKQEQQAQVWRGFLDDTPENWCALGTDMCSFVDGQIWVRPGQGVTPTTPRNIFYGTYYPFLITPVFNGVAPQHNSINKVWNSLRAIITQGGQAGGGNPGTCNLYSDPSQGNGIGISNMYGQQSRLKAANWLSDENHFAIDFLRDLNDISVPLGPAPNPLGNRVLNGMVLRSEALTVELINDYPGEIVLYGLKADYTLSAGPIK